MRMDKSWTTECEVFYSCTMGRSHTLQQISHRAVSGHSLSSSCVESTGSGRKSRGKTAALHGAPMDLHWESPAPEIRDAAPSAKPAWGSAAAPCDPGGTARGGWITTAPSVGTADPPMEAGKQLLTPVEGVLEGAGSDSSCCTRAVFLARTQVIILSEIPSKRLTGSLQLAKLTAVTCQARAEPRARSH